MPAIDTADDLLRQVARGDLDAFARLYDDLVASVFGVARRVVRDPSLAEEVTQEVFLQAWQQAARYDAALGSAKTWLLTITHRRAVDAVRSTQAARDRESRAGAESPVTHWHVEDDVIAADEADGVRRCLESLTPLQRESVHLAYFQGLTYPQVASLLDRPLPTIKTRMRDGLIRLRDCLEGGAR